MFSSMGQPLLKLVLLENRNIRCIVGKESRPMTAKKQNSFSEIKNNFRNAEDIRPGHELMKVNNNVYTNVFTL